ncbi:MAG TPA: glycosyltransferase [Thermoanaerobaculaceae bacterium]|nr:glycosyltransferase [Thermoanaerobaculaceae bacterium]
MPKGLFIVHGGHLRAGGGGVQACTREYFESIVAAGVELATMEVPTDRRPLVRLLRRVRPDPYRHLIDVEAALKTVSGRLSDGIGFVFLNQRSLAVLAPGIRPLLAAGGRIVLLSHGLESVDYYHSIRTRRQLGSIVARSSMSGSLGALLAEEGRQNKYLDHVCCPSDFEAGVERWLGAPAVTVVPRTIKARSLDWEPQPGRFGFVGTLSHPPNAEGLLLLLEALSAVAPPKVQLVVVGGPEECGREFARRFPLVRYLGPLDDSELEVEARTWNCFVHPLFCFARGVSTKLATAIGWGIPIATTPAGCRGYVWRSGRIPQAADPPSLARVALAMMKPDVAHQARRDVVAVAASSPTTADVANIFRSILSPAGGVDPGVRN